MQFKNIIKGYATEQNDLEIVKRGKAVLPFHKTIY